ncbi:MAG: TetR/AcrR family transcriptional regulator [Lachnospiraceae bacterium]|nr:TetR/AcrR family transcriptional regulator [Lachnospiraceae bacterium]
MYDETQEKIIEATMNLVMEKGYSLTTTKAIAKMAGVNECTVFRRFKNKKDIILAAMQLPKWNPSLKETDFSRMGDIRSDLISFSQQYMKKVTPQMVKLSIGLRTPELAKETSEGILKVPMTFKNVLVECFDEYLNERSIDSESLAMQFLSMNFGFVFLKASFGEKLSAIEEKEYIINSVDVFLHGIINMKV